MVRLVPCGCGTQYLVRVERSWWMRAFAWRRLYFCTQCRATLFIRKPALALPGSVRGSLPPPLSEPRNQPAAPQPLPATLRGDAGVTRD